MASSVSDFAALAHRVYQESTWDLPDDLEALVELQGQDEATVAVRGTELDLRDIKTDLKTYLVAYPHFDRAETHAGFLKAGQLLADKIEQELHGRMVSLTGHSLGAAVALVAATILERRRGRDDLCRVIVDRLVLFGCPRVGNKYFRSLVSTTFPGNRLLRIVNAMDIVCGVPPWLWGFRHVGTLVYQTNRGVWINPNFFKRFYLRLTEKRSPISAHGMALYLERARRELV